MLKTLRTLRNHISWNRPWTFRLRKPLRVFFERGRLTPGGRSWTIQLDIGPGAGYILGYTLYLARWCRGHDSQLYKHLPWQYGFTQNANAVPYVSH